MSSSVYLIEGARTPILKARGKAGPFASADLATLAGRHLMMKTNINADDIDETILGCVMPSEREANIGRIASLRIGVPESVPAWTVQRNCASGMQAVDCAMNRIQLGHSDIVLAGGSEAMSRAPIMFSDKYVGFLGRLMAAKTPVAKLKVISSFRPSLLAPVFALEHGLTDPVVSLNMGQTAEKIAERFGITRPQMDEWAVRSHLRATEAAESGVFDGEIVPVIDGSGKLYERDDGVRADSNVEKLSTLKPVFEKPYGKVTAANSSQISDGAAWVILASESAVERHNLKPIAKITDVRWAGLDPAEMGLGPAHSIAELLKANELNIGDIDYWEINEAFAAQVLACVEAMASDEYCRDKIGLQSALGNVPVDRLNIHGGAVACGHPVGMSGARIILHMARTLHLKNAQRGVSSLCIGGGQGGAALIERV
jgi:acetyl-CoA C-acetyltransferase